jgi:hypothetical protein
MTTAILYRAYRVDLDAPTWPEEMSDGDRLVAVVQAARSEPDEVFEYLEQCDVFGSLE